jgi:uncharacterized membrane protein
LQEKIRISSRSHPREGGARGLTRFGEAARVLTWRRPTTVWLAETSARIEALSDGLFGVAMTLLVLEIHTPESLDIHTEGRLMAALGALAPRLLTWLMSLMTLGIFWVGQQAQLSELERSDRNLTWLHFLFLATITVLPFSTRLLADFFTFRTAFIVYWANIFLAGAALYGTWAYAERADLIRAEARGVVSTAIRKRIVVAQSLYAAGALAGLFNVMLGIALIIAIQLNYALAPRLPFLSKL